MKMDKNTVERLDEFKRNSWFFESWMEDPDCEPQDREAEEFQRDFMPMYRKYAGTKSLLKHVREYLSSHHIDRLESDRLEDLQIQLTIMWINHIQLYREFRGHEFKASDIFSVRIPKCIKQITQQK